MNHALFVTCLVIFLVVPPILFAVKYLQNKPSWWAIYAVILIFGWLTALGAIVFYYQYLGDLIAQYQKPPEELLERWANDGAKKVFGLVFGWLYSLIYSLPWLLLYCIAVIIRNWGRRHRLKNQAPSP